METEWHSLWIGFGPFVVAALVKYAIKPLKCWSKMTPLSRRFIVLFLSAIWTSVYAGVSALQEGATASGALAVFVSATASIVLAELKKGFLETKDLKSGARIK